MDTKKLRQKILDLAVSVDLRHQIPPFLSLAGDLIYNKMQK